MLFHLKTTLILPDHIFRELKRQAARRRTTLSAIVAEVLRRGLDAPGPRRDLPPLPAHPMGRPLVDVADRDALFQAMEGR